MFALCALAGLIGCGDDESFFEVEDTIEPVFYDVEVEGLPGSTIEAQSEAVLQIYRQQADGAPSVGFLRRRAQDDIATMAALLRSRGFMIPEISVEVTDPESEAGRALVVMQVDPGRRFQLAEHRIAIINAAPEPVPVQAEELGSPVGRGAIAEEIIGAEDAAVAFLRRSGYAYATFVERDSEANPATGTVTVISTIDAGRRYDFGQLSFSGLEDVEQSYLETYLGWEQGERFNAAFLPTLEEDYAGTSLFSSLTVSIPEEPPATEQIPVDVAVRERLPRTFSLGLRFDTDVGPEVGGSVTHRNLGGRNETGTIGGTVNAEVQTLALDYRVPQFLRDGQDLVFHTEVNRFDQDAFSGQSYGASVGLERQVSRRWRAGLGVAFEYSDIIDSGNPQESILVGPPVFVAYDSARNRLDPRNGARARIDASPYTGTVDQESVAFLRFDGRLSTYRRLDPGGEFVLALRGRFGGIVTNSIVEVPAPLRLYAGGGSSVRGFATDSIGPTDGRGDPRGGVSVIEVGGEIRWRFSENFGAAFFTEAGVVDDSQTPENLGDWRQGFGAGLRFFSPLGPIRGDIASPVERRAGEDPFQIYLSLGQAF
ncbi:MAG: autotransporter assembly complex family protein [Pseudomonadota bacterium]